MSKPIRNMVAFIAILLLGILAGAYSFNFPENIEGAARSAIAALSIIFGLSTAISSLLTSYSTDVSSYSNDPHLAARQKEKAEDDDGRTLSRQMVLYLVTISSIVLGIVFLVAVKDAPHSMITKVIASLFSGGVTVSLLSTMFLPSLLASLIRRNAYFER